MKKTVITFTTLCLLSLASVSFAHENPGQPSICYLFQNNKLKSKSDCVVRTGGGAGSMYTSYKIGRKTYDFETSTMSEEETTEYHAPHMKAKKAIDYTRDRKSLAILSKKQIETAKDFIFCIRTQDRKIDICSL